MHSNETEITASQAGGTDWLAFRYVANEMSHDERQRFEERLSDDQAAREAVASAVELTQTIASIETVEHAVELSARNVFQNRRWQRATWTAAAMAGCLAVVLGWQLVGQLLKGNPSQRSGISHRRAASGSDSDKLAQAWLDTAGETFVFLPAEAAAGETGSLTRSADLEGLAPPEVSTSILDSKDLEAPDWMMAAVSGMSVEMSETEEQ